MSKFIRVRTLMPNEEKYFRKSDLGKKAVDISSIAIMGPDDLNDIKTLKTEPMGNYVHLGGGRYFEDFGSDTVAVGGKTAPIIMWNIEYPRNYLLRGARELDIPVFDTPSTHVRPWYFESRYADAFLESFIYADFALYDWYTNRPVLSRWFGGSLPDINDKAAKLIMERVKSILAKSKLSGSESV